MAQKPRTTRKKRPANVSKTNNASTPSEPGYIGSALNAVSSMSVQQKIGLGVSAIALVSTAVVRLSQSSYMNNTKNGKQTKGKTLGGRTKGRGNGFDDRSNAFPELDVTKFKSSGTRKGGKLPKIPSVQVTKAFQACLSSKRPQQQLIADQFYEEINKWSSEQLDVDGQTIVVNNVPETRFHSEQAEHIRYWADYAISDDVKWDFYNIKFDYMYSTALMQKSIPHMKKFYNWIQSEAPRPTPDEAKSKKPNYYLTRYQAACILGDWSVGVRSMGQIIKDISSKATSSNATRNDFFMHYTLRALELPASNPNFGLIFKIVDKLIAEFPKSEMAPPIFANWNILSFRYKNCESGTTFLDDQDFIFASDKIKGEDGFYTFYPQATTLTSRINKKINIWGRVCQIVSPVFGAAGFLPLTGSWNDTKIYMQTNWTFRGSGNRLTRKHVIMRMERLPIEKEVESQDYFGKTKKEKGYVWKGYLTVHMKKLAKGVTIRNLYDDQGEDYFDGEEAIKRKQNEEVTGNGVVDGETESEKKNESETQTMVYEVEMVIDKYCNEAEKDKELKKRILSAMSGSPNRPTPR